jgi:hypothetical protein
MQESVECAARDDQGEGIAGWKPRYMEEIAGLKPGTY